MKGHHPRDIVERAEAIPIEMVLEDLFGISAPIGAGSWKCNCPLDSEHSDGGRTKAMRIYSESNTSWCFSHSRKFTPVSLWRLTRRSSALEAARGLLDHFNQSFDPPTLTERWDKLNAAEEHTPDFDALRESVMLYANANLPGFSSLQYQPEVMALLSSVLTGISDLSSGADYATIRGRIEKAKEELREYWRDHGWY